MMTRDKTCSRLPDDDAETLSLTAAALYDAALDPSRWPAAMATASCFVESFSTVIYEWSSGGRAGGFLHDDGALSPEFKAKYQERYATIDTVTARLADGEIDETASVLEVTDIERYHQSRFYREWSAPQQIIDLMTAPLSRSEGSTKLLGVVRHERDGMADDTLRRRMRLLVPHVRRALAISEQMATGPERAADLAATLDQLAAGVFLLDAEGRIVHANAAGEAELSDKRAVAVRDGRFSTADANSSRAVLTTIGRAESGTGLSTPVMGHDGEPYAAHLVPLGSAAGGIVPAGRAVAAVFLHRATLDVGRGPNLVARAYDLTPAEQRVLAHIIEAGNVADTAERLRLSEATVKTHLKHIYAKTGTLRQVDLIRLVAGFAGPLRG